MSKNERASNINSILFSHNNRELVLPTSSILQRLGVQEIIRIPNSDYPETSTIGTTLVHFGLPIHDKHLDTIVVLSRIQENGYFQANGEERLPLLSFNNVWIAKKIGLIESIPHHLLKRDIFRNTIGPCSNVPELQKLILSRYRETLPDLTNEEILSQGVSIRHVKLLQKISLSF